MDDNRLKFGVGVLVIAAIGIGIILTFLFGAVPRVLTGEYKLLVAFPAADGINTNSPVLLRGVQIGRVVNTQLRGDDVLLTLGIDQAYREKLTHEYLPRIGLGNVISGDSKLEFYEASEAELLATHKDRWPEIRNEVYNDQDYLKFGKKSGDPFSLLFDMEEEMRETLKSVRTASDSLGTVGENINLLVGDARSAVGGADEELAGVAQDARLALIEFQGAMRDVRSLLGSEEVKNSLGDALAELPEVLSEARNTFQSTQKAFQSFESVGERFADVGVAAEKAVKNVDQTVDSVRDTVQSAKRSVENIERITGPLAENSEELVAQVMSSLGNLDKSLKQVEQFGAAINNSDGTLRRLLDDDAMYWQIRRTVENIEEATAKIRPILDDARIFSDKIARDPRQLGVKGALDKRPSGYGLK